MPKLLLAIFMITCSSPVWASDGEILITHGKALAGNVTPGDAAGYPVTLTVGNTAYKLAGPLSPPPGKDAIAVNANYATLDLGGFALQGGGQARYGIYTAYNGLEVRNGTITNFRQDAIFATDASSYLRVTKTHLINNGEGVNGGKFAWIVDNVIVGNTYNGIGCASCHVESNIVASGRDYGIFMRGGSVLGNTVMFNARLGIAGDANTGFGNNLVSGNNGGAAQVSPNLPSLHPNICVPAC